MSQHVQYPSGLVNMVNAPTPHPFARTEVPSDQMCYSSANLAPPPPFSFPSTIQILPSSYPIHQSPTSLAPNQITSSNPSTKPPSYTFPPSMVVSSSFSHQEFATIPVRPTTSSESPLTNQLTNLCLVQSPSSSPQFVPGVTERGTSSHTLQVDDGEQVDLLRQKTLTSNDSALIPDMEASPQGFNSFLPPCDDPSDTSNNHLDSVSIYNFKEQKPTVTFDWGDPSVGSSGASGDSLVPAAPPAGTFDPNTTLSVPASQATRLKQPLDFQQSLEPQYRQHVSPSSHLPNSQEPSYLLQQNSSHPFSSEQLPCVSQPQALTESSDLHALSSPLAYSSQQFHASEREFPPHEPQLASPSVQQQIRHNATPTALSHLNSMRRHSCFQGPVQPPPQTHFQPSPNPHPCKMEGSNPSSLIQEKGLCTTHPSGNSEPSRSFVFGAPEKPSVSTELTFDRASSTSPTPHQWHAPQGPVRASRSESPNPPGAFSFMENPSSPAQVPLSHTVRRPGRPDGRDISLAMIAAANRFKKEALLQTDGHSTVLSHTVPHPKSVFQSSPSGPPDLVQGVSAVQSNSVGVTAAVAAMADGALLESGCSIFESEDGCEVPSQRKENVEEDAKKALRATRNRQSAAASRERKKAYERDLERRFALLSEQTTILQRNLLEGIEDSLTDEKRLKKENEELRRRVELKKAEIEKLKKRLQKHGKNKGDTSGVARSNSWDSSHWKKKKSDI